MAADYEKLGVFYLGREYDAAGAKPCDAKLLYDSRDLTTHAVCVGMTGSGKTGLCLALLEEAAIDGIPAICIDPKGDLGNLLLTFPQLTPAQFEPWVDAGEAAREGLSVTEYAAQVAAQWRNGLGDWDQDAERIVRLRESVDLAIYTPGSDSGLPLSILNSLTGPVAPAADGDGATADAPRAERATALAGSLLTLLKRDADPLHSREHTLLSNIFEQVWRTDAALDLAALIALVQKPPFDRIGAFDLETFVPTKARRDLAMAINNLIAAPTFAAWTQGEPLDAQRLLFTPEGKPRVAVICIAHLADAERMFFVTLLLGELVAWMRRQTGTSSLRAILYMDEIFGYFPPSANPPSKQPMLTLLKQARAYGLGCVLATQNPVDLDYKGLGNAGTWFIGRLQTQRDRDRVLDGLTSALPGGIDRAQLGAQLGALTPRVFLMRNVHDDAAVLMKSRWALSYLRGPLTGPEIARLMATRKSTPVASSATRDPSSVVPEILAPGGQARPALAAQVSQYFLPVNGASAAITYRPRILATARLHFVDAAQDIDKWQIVSEVAPLSDDGAQVMWAEAAVLGVARESLGREPLASAVYANLPAAAMRDDSYRQWGRSFAAHVYETARLELWQCAAPPLTSGPEESAGDFKARCALRLREQRDERVEGLRRKYAPRMLAAQDALRHAGERAARERSQLSQQKVQTAISIGATVLGALFGRRKISATSIGRATTAARSAGRIGRELQDVERAAEGEQILRQRLADLERDCAAEIASIQAGTGEPIIRTISIAPRKSDVAIGEIALLWVPWHRRPDGTAAPAFEQ